MSFGKPSRRVRSSLVRGVSIALVANATIFAVSCGKSQAKSGNESGVATRALTNAEALDDLAEIVSKVKGLYGPLDYKEARFGYKLADLESKARARIEAAKGEDEVLAALREFVMAFEDGHVSLTFPMTSSDRAFSWSIPIGLEPIEGRAIVDRVNDSMAASGIEAGDELLAVDGKKPFDMLETIKRYEALGNDVSDAHMILRVLNRPAYMPELTPTKETAMLRVKKATGEERDVEAAWRRSDNLPSVKDMFPKRSGRAAWFVADNALTLDGFLRADAALSKKAGIAPKKGFKSSLHASIFEMGDATPFFATEAVKSTYKLVQVKPSAESLAAFGIENAEKAPTVYASMYRAEGKTILLVRQPDYVPEDEAASLNAYRALLSEYEPLVDVLVIDQTHNPGGSLWYCMGFARLFMNKPGNGFVQKMHADRAWIQDFKTFNEDLVNGDTSKDISRLALAAAAIIEKAYDAGKRMTDEFLAITPDMQTSLLPDEQYTWKKPMIVLADELAGSCGDIFPMLMKDNGVAKVFGERTMGLGGNVEKVATLSNSRGELRLTRGLFATYRPDGKYDLTNLTENGGVKPDQQYAHTVDDARAGYVGYVETFTKYAISQIK